jgi:hypothetical protein
VAVDREDRVKALEAALEKLRSAVLLARDASWDLASPEHIDEMIDAGLAAAESVLPFGPNDDEQGHARLLAAAPDLLTELKAALALVGSGLVLAVGDDNRDLAKAFSAGVKRIDRAIAKAEGRDPAEGEKQP